MMSDLKQLREKREEILKAELAAWLHDVGKLSVEFVNEHSMRKTDSEKWHHELVLRRILRKIERAIGKSWQEITKDEVRQWMENEFSLSIPKEKRERPFPNPKRKDFPNKLRSYLERDPVTGDEKTRAKLVEIASQIVSESRILQDFFAKTFYDFCDRTKISISDEQILVGDFIEQHGDPVSSKSKLVSLFKPPGCDGLDSAMDKGKAESSQKDKVFVATAFGFEHLYLRHLDCLRKALSAKFTLFHKNYSCKRRTFLDALKRAFSKALGETRRAANDVTLWDHSYSVGALYKSLVGWIALSRSQVPEVTEFVQNGQWMGKLWRLLSIRTNGLEYLLSASSIPDLKARQDLLQDAWDRVRDLLEEEYPLALEVYRDENGPVFVVPDIDNLLGLTDPDRNYQTLREVILERFRQGTVQSDPCLALEGEVIPEFFLDIDSWDGQSKLPPIGEHLKREPVLRVDPQWVSAQWCNLPRPRERCLVCGLRPQGPSRKAQRRGRCDVCEKRRTGRAERWATKDLQTTIWLDEVADKNGRMALLVGTFDLTHWLDGALVRSLAVRTPNDQNGHTAEDIAKNPSFARLRRIWETTRKFWEEALKEAEDRLDKRPRLFFKGELQQGSLGRYHAYELEIRGRKVAVLWVPENATDEEGNALRYRGGFWVIENLEYLKSEQIFGRDLREILEKGTSYAVYEPTEYGRPGQPVATFELKAIFPKEPQEKEKVSYIPLIPILAEPRTFMALVPANKAFEVVKAIKTKYEVEMGRVRNRLPLHLGIVFADSHQPLRTILDAGRRMLKLNSLASIWEVKKVKQFGEPNNPNETKGWRALSLLRYSDLIKQHPNQFRALIGIRLENKWSCRDFTWFVPAVMGDGRTEDHWYPYVYLATSDEPIDRRRYYKTDLGNPWNPDHPWLVHAAELEPGDIIYFTPATFDFLWLGHGGDRFRLAYDKEGRRLGTLHRPYLLDELEELERCWHLLKEGLSSNQLHQVRDLIEGKRAEWFEDPESSVQDLTFRNFCKDVLRNAEWTDEPTEEFECLTQWAVSGLLADAVELFYHIMKERTLKNE